VRLPTNCQPIPRPGRHIEENQTVPFPRPRMSPHHEADPRRVIGEGRGSHVNVYLLCQTVPPAHKPLIGASVSAPAQPPLPLRERKA